MQVDQKIPGIFQELLNQASSLMQTRTSGGGEIRRTRPPGLNLSYDKVSPEGATEWGMSCLNLLKRVCGAESDYYQAFKEQSSGFESFDNYGYVTQALSILKAAKHDYEKGNLLETRILIQAEVFENFLEQADHLLKNGYHVPAAVLAGSVLEDGLRKLCVRNKIALGSKATIDPMNIELAKAGVYSTLVQKRNTVLADIRNKAAHGKWDAFRDKDVEQMIAQVRSFMEEFFS